MRSTVRDSVRYRTFIEARNLALERMHNNMQLDISRTMHDFLLEIEHKIAHILITSSPDLTHMRMYSDSLTQQINQLLSGVFFHSLEGMIRRYRKAIKILTYTSELEALARATGKQKIVSKKDLDKALDDLKDGSIQERVWYDLNKLRDKVVQAFNLAMLQDLSKEEVLQKVRDVFPKAVVYSRPPRNLKPIREADARKPDKEMFDFQFIDDGDWNLTVGAFKDTELPPSRFDQGASFDHETGTMAYQWELEQDLRHDFIEQVRGGQIEAATQLGIKDFVWIAVLDNKTCEHCCLPRNGKTTREIEEMLSSGKLDSEHCDAITPPAHFNCRCDIGPVASVEEVEGPDWKAFDDWLSS